jgi:glycosyltransferase involved in cell wall biosynthesis
MVERKGFADLIRVLPHVPRARLVVVGGPPAPDLKQDPLAARLMRLADKLKVADRVRLLGAVAHADMPLLYRAADVVACTPWYEPFGITPLEAMASGTPVVTYAVGGLKESVVDGVSGVLVPARDVRSLALALRRLLGDQVSRMSYASAAVDRARSRYQWPRQAADMERAYERAIHGSAERGTESLTDSAMGVAS